MERSALPCVAGIAAFLAFTGDVMLLTFLGWTEAAGADLGIHRLHVMAIGAYLAAAFLVLLSTLWRPVARPAGVVSFVPGVVFLSLAVFAGPASQGDPVPFLAIAALLAVFHPAGRRIFRRSESYSPALLALVAVAAVPVIAYVVHEATLQLALGDVHALDAHYGLMAATGGFVLVNGLLAALGVPGWRPLAWIGGGLMAFLGVMSVTFPAQASSVGTTWGMLAIGWAVAFVAAAELSRSRGASGVLRRELPGARPS